MYVTHKSKYCLAINVSVLLTPINRYTANITFTPNNWANPASVIVYGMNDSTNAVGYTLYGVHLIASVREYHIKSTASMVYSFYGAVP